jgi:phosphate:Na+ symporter
MYTVVASVIGGIGLFLLGMILMTDGLKSLAGDALRSILSRYTTNRYSAVGAGAGITALVQSSSATTLATIGFVSAGLLPFSNAVGVNIGAALGTTSTGWIVSLLGLKLSVGKIMLPVIGIGAGLKLMARGRWAKIGMALAGFGVIFVGIDVLQAGMAGLAEEFSPANFPDAHFGGRIVLALIGIAMTVVMQSSSAAVATTLAAVAGGTINLEQAACVVIGANVGTTITAGIASLGASTSARRTALAHIIYNATTGVMAFVVLPLFLLLVDTLPDLFTDAAITIAAFHTSFNLLGVVVFLPFLTGFSKLVERLVKTKGPRLTQNLDPSLVSVPPVAIEAARRTLKGIGVELFEYLAAHLRADRRLPGTELLDELDVALAETRRFLVRIPPPDTQGYEFHRQISTMHAIDHLERLTAEAREHRKLKQARGADRLRESCDELSNLLDLLAAQIQAPKVEPDVERAQAFSQRLADERRNARPAILEATAARRIDPDRALADLSAQRWLDRVAYHVWRTTHHLREMTREELAEHAQTSADAGGSEFGKEEED